MRTVLIACPSCSCHAFARELVCPSCGAPMRAADGSLQRTAGAVLLGLSLAVTSAACGNDVHGGKGNSSGGGYGGEGESTYSSMGGLQVSSSYGAGATWSSSSNAAGGAGDLGDAGAYDAGAYDAGAYDAGAYDAGSVDGGK